ncbi:hypothetical protein ACJVDH_02580 [Pedobacter sp. AW1-32]|uniref:hypothetical protein n=1 Tax=Pedobacter sp. AW1-32 TaxID=3383026 RepID=UPI003FF07D6C
MTKQFFSYVDTALRVISINNTSVATAEGEAEINEKLIAADGSKYAKTELLGALIDLEIQHNQELRDVIDHEMHHYMQTLHYPFLYYLCWLEFDNLNYLRALIRDSEVKSFPIANISLPPDFQQNFKFTTHKVEFFWVHDRLWLGTVKNDTPSSSIFSLNDLLEDATTIFQYKGTTQSPNYQDCYDWIMDPSRTCYRRLYKFLVKRIGKKRAYDLIPLAIQLAFFTTEPLSMFCNVISLTNYRFADYDSYTIQENFERILDSIRGEIGNWEGSLMDYVLLGKLPVKVFAHHNLSELIDSEVLDKGEFHFPLALHAKKFIKSLETDRSLIYNLINHDQENKRKLLSDFQPMAIHFRFSNRLGRDSILAVGEDYRNVLSPAGMGYDNYLKEIIKVVGTTHQLLTRHHDNLLSNCHHVNCSYYDIGLCKKWTSVPKDYTTCGFPYWFSWVFLRSINLDTRSLDKMERSVAEQAWETYASTSFRPRQFNFLMEDGNISLTISPKEINAPGKNTLFRDFLAYMQKEHNLESQSLVGKISLVVHGYNRDPRELFEIAEVRKWLHTTFEDFKEFLCYIDFSSTQGHEIFIKCSFVKHRKILVENNRLSFIFDECDR